VKQPKRIPDPPFAAAVPAAGDTPPPLILVVDDYEDNRDMYSQYLQFVGMRVAEAANGKEALSKTAELLPDLIVMDLSLPHISGWEAMRRLKDDPATAHIPIIACTAHVLASACERAVDAGCSAYLTKPCLPVELFAEVRRVLGKRAA